MRQKIAIGLLLYCTGCAPQVKDAGDTESKEHAPAGTSSVQPPPKQKPAEVLDDAFGSVAEAIEALCLAAKTENGEELRVAETWLLRQGSQPVTPLARIVQDEKDAIAGRIVACRVLRKMGAAAKPAWKKALECQPKQIRINAIRGLAALKPTDAATLEALAALLDESDDTLKSEAATAVAKIGPPAADACADKLLAIFNDSAESNAVRETAKKALKAVKPRRTLAD